MKKIFIAPLLCIPALLGAQILTPPPSAPPASIPNASPPKVEPPPVVTTEGPRLTAEQTANIMKQLDQIEGIVTKDRGDKLGGALARCIKGAASEKDTLALYMDCYRVEHFEKLNLKATDFTDWARNNEAKLKDPEFLYGLWLQLEYLVMSIQAQDARETKDLAPLVTGLQTFVQKEVTAVQNATSHTAAGALKDKPKAGNGKGARASSSGQLLARLRESVRQSEFSKAFQLKDFLKRDDWEYEPLAIAGIYDQVIFPYYLEKKPAELSAQWDTRIKAELALKQALTSENDFALYVKDRYPVLLWRKSQYLLSHNVNVILAMADMLKVLRDNPTHPSARDWLSELRDLVNKAQPDGPPTQGNPETAASAAAATK